ncbi:hypothetical protein C8Q78DRAFT_156944 [Trametes maxima]|nr:hypothetical protein C8Q78DRAFT_156944 [Trametes maxima]
MGDRLTRKTRACRWLKNRVTFLGIFSVWIRCNGSYTCAGVCRRRVTKEDTRYAKTVDRFAQGGSAPSAAGKALGARSADRRNTVACPGYSSICWRSNKAAERAWENPTERSQEAVYPAWHETASPVILRVKF